MQCSQLAPSSLASVTSSGRDVHTAYCFSDCPGLPQSYQYLSAPFDNTWLHLWPLLVPVTEQSSGPQAQGLTSTATKVIKKASGKTYIIS